ncbi:TonB-dependent receptor plug domain-containing protein, partial [Draconibacterium sp.]|uniref:TonB-dependent receptor plug domain-containing protein n=1 Tax=Draconibacterium sp. TaxID=1965318 RepID=UPI003563D364
MIKFKLTVFIILLSVLAAFSQSYVRVINAKTGSPIEHAMLISGNFITQTDGEGRAKLDGFSADEKILFKHSSYIPYVSTRQKIENQSRTVLLVESPVRLDEVVVSVNRWKQSKTEIPHTIKSIQPEEIMHYNPQTAADMLGTESGIFIQKSQMGGGSPMIRGFAANRVLIMVDGIRMNNAI